MLVSWAICYAIFSNTFSLLFGFNEARGRALAFSERNMGTVCFRGVFVRVYCIGDGLVLSE